MPTARSPRASRKRCVVIDGRAPRDVVARAHLGRPSSSVCIPGSRAGRNGGAVSDDEPTTRRPASARNRRAVRPRRGRAARLLEAYQKRAHSACLADRRPARHRQGDARLSHGALRAGASRSARGGGAERAHRSRSIPTTPVARRIAAQAHGDLLVLERVINEKTGKLFTVIRVEDVRRTISFFGSTAGEGGWRVCIVDNADELQYPQAANALLKVLEEPPARALLLLVSHAPGRAAADHPLALPPLLLRPLEAADVARAVAAATGRDADEAEVREAARRRRRQRRARARPSRRTRRWRCASACSICSRNCPTPTRARCMRSATASAATSRRRLPPSSTWSMSGSRARLDAGAAPAG